VAPAIFLPFQKRDFLKPIYPCTRTVPNGTVPRHAYPPLNRHGRALLQLIDEVIDAQVAQPFQSRLHFTQTLQ
jgi:hypothetical protein